MTERSTARRVLYIPPELRGAARAISDVDPTQFPELYPIPSSASPSPGEHNGAGPKRQLYRAPPVAALAQLTTELNDGVPMSARDFRLLRIAYAECRQHLRSVPAHIMASGTPLSEVLALTTRLDALCSETAVVMTEQFPLLKIVHAFVLGMSEDSERAGTHAAMQRYGGGEQLLVQGLMLRFLCAVLGRGVDAMEEYRALQLTAAARGRAALHDRAGAPALLSPPQLQPQPLPPALTHSPHAGTPSTAMNGSRAGGSPGAAGAASAAGPVGRLRALRRNVSITVPARHDAPLVRAYSANIDGESEDDPGADAPVDRTSISEEPAHRSPLLGYDGNRPAGSDAAGLQAAAPDSAAQADDAADNEDGGSGAGAAYAGGGGGGGLVLPASVAEALHSVNADMQAHLAHLRWLVTVTSSSALATFDAGEHLEDSAMQKVWAQYIGCGRPACTTAVFEASGLMMLFPAWMKQPMMQVLDFKQCGVVSVFTVQRLLSVWGPLLLLDRNLQDDASSGVFSFAEPFMFLERTLAMRPDAQVGDYVAALTDVPGDVRLTVLRPALRHANSHRHLGAQPYGRSRSRGHNASLGGSGPDCFQASYPSVFGSSSCVGGMAAAPAGGGAAMRPSRRRSRWPSKASYYDRHQQSHYLRAGARQAHGAEHYPGADDSAPLSPLNGAAGAADVAGGGLAGGGNPCGLSFSMLAPPALRPTSYRLSQATGAWTVQGLTKEEFESVTEACHAFPDIFRRPRGERWTPLVDDADGGEAALGRTPADGAATSPRGCCVNLRVAQESGTSSARANTPGRPPSAPTRRRRSLESVTSSGLHRACFRNNTRYVRTLLTRGARTVVNTAVIDPAVSGSYSWSPLLCSVNNPNADPTEVVELLLRAGAQADYQDDASCTALYYAIANGYAGAAKLLLDHCPSLMTSPETVPLLVALGAHHYLPCERDVRRLTDVAPSAAMMEALCAHAQDYRLCSLALRILQDKLNREDLAFDTAVMEEVVLPQCPAGLAAAELHTPEEEATLARLIRYHTMTLCCQYDVAARRAMRVLCGRCYVLSLRERLQRPPTPQEADAPPEETPVPSAGGELEKSTDSPTLAPPST